MATLPAPQRRCTLSQPALTRSLQALEAQVGEQLFDRSHREVTPTTMGELLLQHARQLLLHAQDLQRDLQLACGLEQGELRVGVGPFAGAALVAPVLAILNRAYPGVHLDGGAGTLARVARTFAAPRNRPAGRRLARD
ncbi:LysR family transcriptional regulator [Pseudomonas aeruginosa]|uniref:LysR family transcriptional regulator n=1 Tax=Pseudomonas aeruginosa TaxID=287 RepID=UPI001FD80954|nr:LysR family transcriptional regulator [Pseudomonas aeruginosa]